MNRLQQVRPWRIRPASINPSCGPAHRSPLSRFWLGLLGVVLATSVVHAEEKRAAFPPTTGPAASQPNLVHYQPGVDINWSERQVEVAATVILREGGLELFACSPRIREHEAVVRIEARPLHVYQALGLIGLEPGHPVRLHPETGEVQPATGDPVEILVRYESAGRTREVPIENWMRHAGTGRPLDRLPWVFAGSVPEGDGGIGADQEGTVIAVVDFGTALIALPERHSDRNELLWLEPDADRLPPVGTSCRLIFRLGPIRLHLERTGRLLLNGQASTMAAAARALRQARRENPEQPIHITIEADSPRAREEPLLDLLDTLTVPRRLITIERPGPQAAARHEPDIFASWAWRRWDRADTSLSAWAAAAQDWAEAIERQHRAVRADGRALLERASCFLDDRVTGGAAAGSVPLPSPGPVHAVTLHPPEFR